MNADRAARKRRDRRWTLNGIRRFCPWLECAEWLGICGRGGQYRKDLPALLPPPGSNAPESGEGSIGDESG